MVQTMYRGEVTEVRADGVMVHVPDLGYQMQFGPCQTNNFPLSIGDGVLMAQASGYKEDLVIVGPLKMYVPHPDVTYGVYDFTNKVARNTKFNGPAMPSAPTVALVEDTSDIFWWDFNGVASNQAGSVVDRFTDASLSALKWPSLAGGVTFDTTNTRAVLPVIAAYSTMATDSTSRFTLVNSYVAAQLSLTTSTSRELYMEAIVDTNNRVSMLVSGTTLYARIKSASTTVFQVTGAYNATNHAWWRFRHDSTYIYFETSTDGANWSSFATYTIQVGDTVWNNVYVQFSAGYYGTESASNAYVSNVNYSLWWKSVMDADKSPKFNNMTLRGSLTAAGETINGDATVTGLVTAGSASVTGTTTLVTVYYKGATLYYNGTPGATTLYASIAPAAGTDPYGTAYRAGMSFYRQVNNTGGSIHLNPANDGTHTYLPAYIDPYGNAGDAVVSLYSPQDSSQVGDYPAAISLYNKNGTFSLIDLNADQTQVDGPLKLQGTPPLSNGVFVIARYFVEASSGATAVNTSAVDIPGATITVTVPTIGSNTAVKWRVIGHADIACTTLATNVAGQVALFLDGVSMAGARTIRLVAGAVNDAALCSRTWDNNATVVAGSLHTWKFAINLSTGNTARYSAQAPATCFTLEFYL